MDRIARGTEEPTLVQPNEPLLINTRASSAAEEISDSWRRCVVDYRIDLRSRTVPNIITQGKLKVFREPLADVIVHAREEIDRLCAIVQQLTGNVSPPIRNFEGNRPRSRSFVVKTDDGGRWILCGEVILNCLRAEPRQAI
jgi:hypothetical protein